MGTPKRFDRSVEFGAYASWYIGRHSGPPTDNPDDCYLKDLIFGMSPYDVVGVSNYDLVAHGPGNVAVDLGFRADDSPRSSSDCIELFGRSVWVDHGSG